LKNIIYDFDYYAPSTVEEVIKLLSQDEEGGAKMIAGGQSLIILLKQRLLTPACMISIKGLTDLDYIKFDESQGLLIGALTTHRAIEKSAVIKEKCSVLAEMEKNLSSVETRNYGTIGGNVCHGDPAGDPLPVFMALDAKFKVAGSAGERVVDAADFTIGYYETVLQHDELLTEIRVPTLPPNTGVKYTKYAQITGDHAIASAAVAITLDANKEKCVDVRIALGAVEPAPIRATKAEELLKGKVITDDLLAEAGRLASEEASYIPDIDSSAEYKKELAGVLVKRTAKEAFAQAVKGGQQ